MDVPLLLEHDKSIIKEVRYSLKMLKTEGLINDILLKIYKGMSKMYT